MDSLIKSWHADGSLVDDQRSLSELQADALVELVAKGAHHHQPARPSVSVVIDHDTLVRRAGEPGGEHGGDTDGGTETDGDTAGRSGHDSSDHADCDHADCGHDEPSDQMPYRSTILGHGPVAPEAIRRMCCNADITRIVMRGTSEPLDVGRDHRLATPAIRKAVWARSDGWCELCHHTRLTWCQLHHIDPWFPTGETSVENSLLVCSHCHHLLHEGGYQAKRTDTGFQLLRPDGSLPRLPLRNRPHPTDTT